MWVVLKTGRCLANHTFFYFSRNIVLAVAAVSSISAVLLLSRLLDSRDSDVFPRRHWLWIFILLPVSLLVAFYDTQGLRWAYSSPGLTGR